MYKKIAIAYQSKTVLLIIYGIRMYVCMYVQTNVFDACYKTLEL